MKKIPNPIISEIEVVQGDNFESYYVEYTNKFIIYYHNFEFLELRAWIIDNYDTSRGQVKIELEPTSIETAENPIYFTQEIDEFIRENYEEIILEILTQPTLTSQSYLGTALYNICRPK
jgi:hypothetical protein